MRQVRKDYLLRYCKNQITRHAASREEGDLIPTTETIEDIFAVLIELLEDVGVRG